MIKEKFNKTWILPGHSKKARKPVTELGNRETNLKIPFTNGIGSRQMAKGEKTLSVCLICSLNHIWAWEWSRMINFKNQGKLMLAE